ncbi:MAG TPA: hypothetical protein EYQ69_04480 [Gemmatimonadetes bacterium]|jgi:hypothetical protein|nr:hypothetical protein [Gemmatimonadota bacterium]
MGVSKQSGSRNHQERTVSLSPSSGKIGEEVTVSTNRLFSNTLFLIGFGALGGNQEILSEVMTDEDGNLEAIVSVPLWASNDLDNFFFVASGDGLQQPIAYSEEFEIIETQC